MSCSTSTDDVPWLTVDTRIVCDKCTLRPGDTAPHQLRFQNLGPLEAKIDLTASCKGPCLGYEGGSPIWTDQLPVPKRRRRPGTATTAKGIELPSGSTVGAQGSDEQIEVEVKRLRGNGTPEKPATLALRIKLRQ